MSRIRLRAGALASACGAALALLSGGGALNAQDESGADVIYTGGPIITIDDARPRAEAVAVDDGRILAVGSRDEVMALRTTETRMVDLAGRTMLPGFVDAHGHVLFGGVQALGANLLAPPDGEVTDIASLQETLRAWQRENRGIVERYGIMIGFGYDNSTLAEKRHPTRLDLDEVSRDVPIYLIHQSGHLAAINSAAIDMLGLAASSPDPFGGVIRREADGEPNGVLEETAHFEALAKLFSRLDEAAWMGIAKAGTDLWARFGYTTAQEGRSTPQAIALLKTFAAAGKLEIDVATYGDVLVGRDAVLAEYSPTYTDRFRVAGAKLTIDGSPQGFTAWRDKPYVDPVGDYPPGYVGYAAIRNEEAIDAVDWAFANGIQIMTHANGEAASDLLIAALDTATRKHGPGDRRPVLIHGQFQREDQVDAYKRLGLIPSLYPMHTFYWGDWHRDHTVGPQFSDDISPTGWAAARGMIFTTHHDAPVAFPDSMRVLDATVTRRSRSGDIIGPAQRVDVMTALKAMTIWPAYQHFEEETKGSIEVGKLADFVVLSADPTAIDPEKIDTIKVEMTIKEGRTIFERGE